jgi:hypothetical protein
MRKSVLLALLVLGAASVALAIPAPSITIDLAGNGSRNVSTWTYGGDYTAHFCPNGSISSPNGAYLSVLYVTNYSVLDGSNEYLDADVSGTQLTKSYDPTKGRLTISGVDTVANYQQVLRTVYYVDSLTTPTVGNRDIEVEAFYGNTGSNAGVCDLSVQRDPKAVPPKNTRVPVNSLPAPTVTPFSNPTQSQMSLFLQPAQNTTPPYIDLSGGNGGPNYSTWTYGGPTYYAHICPNAIVCHSGELKSLMVTLTNRPDGSSEYLAVQNFALSRLSTQGYNAGTGQIIITGSMDSTVCQALLRSIVYVNLKTRPTTSDRIITVRVSSGSVISKLPTMTMGVALNPRTGIQSVIGNGPMQGIVTQTPPLLAKQLPFPTGQPGGAATSESALQQEQAAPDSLIVVTKTPDPAISKPLGTFAFGNVQWLVTCKAVPPSVVTSGSNKAFDTGRFGTALKNALKATCNMQINTNTLTSINFTDIGGTLNHTVYGAYEFTFPDYNFGLTADGKPIPFGPLPPKGDQAGGRSTGGLNFACSYKRGNQTQNVPTKAFHFVQVLGTDDPGYITSVQRKLSECWKDSNMNPPWYWIIDGGGAGQTFVDVAIQPPQPP